VLDPVMVAESGAHLLEPDAREALVGLLARATVVTPNLAEARALVETAGAAVPDDAEALARAVHRLGPRFVVVTGGHSGDAEAIDVFFDGETVVRIGGEMYPGGAAHGSGCTHSSALAAHLALGLAPLEAARAAKRIASEAVRDGLSEIGEGPGPVDVFGLARSALGYNPGR
jgi:hydroxymethylpyrimidine/phosphomethylpyrimidine kinase